MVSKSRDVDFKLYFACRQIYESSKKIVENRRKDYHSSLQLL